MLSSFRLLFLATATAASLSAVPDRTAIPTNNPQALTLLTPPYPPKLSASPSSAPPTLSNLGGLSSLGTLPSFEHVPVPLTVTAPPTPLPSPAPVQAAGAEADKAKPRPEDAKAKTEKLHATAETKKRRDEKAKDKEGETKPVTPAPAPR